ncbi:MAG: DUF2130 domain-containing protein [Patescibacteria group bacterium]
MNDTITCPHCNKTFPVTEAIKHQVEQEVRIKFEREEKQKMWVKALAAAEERTKEKNTQELKLIKEQLDNEKKKREESEKNELQLRKERIKFEEEKKELELTIQRKLDEERKKISDDSYKKALEENRLKSLENEKEKADLLKQIEELKQKASQGSQQAQGDVMERELKNTISLEFPYDEISDVPTGIRGADLVQKVKNNLGRDCGIILWESKRTKNWTEGWISKLKEDKRTIKAEVAIIVTQVLPEGMKNFGVRDGIWISNYQSVVGAAHALRSHLIEISSVKMSNKGKEDKKEILWNYLNGIEFQQRMEAIADVYNQMQDDLEIEKRWFAKKWAKQEKNIRQVIDSISGMDGDLKSITGKSLPEMEELKKLDSGQ